MRMERLLRPDLPLLLSSPHCLQEGPDVCARVRPPEHRLRGTQDTNWKQLQEEPGLGLFPFWTGPHDPTGRGVGNMAFTDGEG